MHSICITLSIFSPELQLLTQLVKLFLCAQGFQLLGAQEHAPWHAAILLAVVQLVRNCAALQVRHLCNGANLHSSVSC